MMHPGQWQYGAGKNRKVLPLENDHCQLFSETSQGSFCIP